jgi:hypothetical protein
VFIVPTLGAFSVFFIFVSIFIFVSVRASSCLWRRTANSSRKSRASREFSAALPRVQFVSRFEYVAARAQGVCKSMFSKRPDHRPVTEDTVEYVRTGSLAPAPTARFPDDALAALHELSQALYARSTASPPPPCMMQPSARTSSSIVMSSLAQAHRS